LKPKINVREKMCKLVKPKKIASYFSDGMNWNCYNSVFSKFEQNMLEKKKEQNQNKDLGNSYEYIWFDRR
jgi:hypothetical protein